MKKYDILLEILVVVKIGVLRNDPDENFEIFLTPVPLYSSGLLHSA
jgi:hypothetical protein